MAERVVLITGAARRIGAAIARDLAAKGWHTIIHYNKSKADAVALSDEIKASGGSCQIAQADLADHAAVERLIPTCLETVGRIDCLINNASLFSYDKIQTLEWELWQRHLSTNLSAPVFLCRDFDRQIPAGETGVIINMLDQKTANVNPDFLSYTTSKVALRSLTKILAMALAPKIRVCGISPGLTLISGKQTQESYEKAAKATPLGISSSVAEIVLAANFILSIASMSGEILTIDGGESLMGRPRDVAFDVT